MVQGIKGLTSGVFYDNIAASFGDAGEAISNATKESEYNLGGQASYGYITTDIYTSFVLLVGIFFPSCTGTQKQSVKIQEFFLTLTFLPLIGIMAGSNRSGDLADPQKSIPVGTIAAIAVTSTVYLASVLLFAATVDPLLLRDK